jgi:type IV pilus assembly protein PilA
MTFPPAGSPPPPPAFSRPFGVILLGTLSSLAALLCLGAAAILFGVAATSADGADGRVILIVVAGVIFAIGAFHALTAIGLFLLKEFGRVCQMIKSGIGLLALPFGTIISALVLYYLTRPGVVLLFSGRSPAAMTPEERDLVARDGNKGVVMVIVAMMAVLGGIAMIGIVAAIAIPGLLRARMAGNEASAIGSLRAMSSAQAAFSATHEGRYGTVACLTAPSSCPNADGSAVTVPFLPPTAAEPGPRSGYTFTLLVSADQSHFVYWAAPALVNQSGIRAFCVTESGVVEEYRDYNIRGPFAPSDPEQGCPADGRPLM